jgi:hypothetical protein
MTKGETFTQVGTSCMACRMWLSAKEDGALPEGLELMADERALEHHTGERSADRQQKQRHQHHPRRFMDMAHDVDRRARLAVEGHEGQPPRIERRQRGGCDRQPEAVERHRVMLPRVSRLDDRVLGDEAGKTDGW